MNKKYLLPLILSLLIAYFEPYMIAVMVMTIAITVLCVYLFNQSASYIRQRIDSSRYSIIKILCINFVALVFSGLILILASYFGEQINTEFFQISKAIRPGGAPILGIWIPLVFLGNYFFFVFIMTNALNDKAD